MTYLVDALLPNQLQPNIWSIALVQQGQEVCFDSAAFAFAECQITPVQQIQYAEIIGRVSA